MDSFSRMISTQAIMVVYMIVGYYCSRKAIIDKNTQTKLTDFVLRITLPCMVFQSVALHSRIGPYFTRVFGDLREI